MEDLDRLIKFAREGDKQEVKSAIDSLAGIGVQSVAAVLKEIRKGPKNNITPFDRVLLRIRDPEIIPVLIGLLGDENTLLVMTAYEALGQSKDERALMALLDRLRDKNDLESYRGMAARALGELGDRRAIEDLLEFADEASKSNMLEPAILAVVALAKLGNHERASIAVSLSDYRQNQKGPGHDPKYDDSEIIRARAAEALQYAIAPGMFPALVKSLSEPGVDIRDYAVDAIFYLGCKESIAELISHIKDENDYMANKKRHRLNDLTGQAFPEGVEEKEIREWWKHHEKDYANYTCYRLGKPIWLPDVIVLLGKPGVLGAVEEELKIITGEKDFGYDPYLYREKLKDLPRKAREWWDKEGHRFEKGRLYKYGFPQDLKSIF